MRLQRRVAFIGGEVRAKLFGNAPAVGETIRISGIAVRSHRRDEEKVQLSNYFRPDK